MMSVHAVGCVTEGDLKPRESESVIIAQNLPDFCLCPRGQ